MKVVQFIKSFFGKTVVKHFLIISAVAFLALGVLWQTSYPAGHDLSYHAASAIGTSNHSFFDIFTSKIYGTVSNDFGYGEGLFYPPLPHVITGLIYKLISPFGLSVYAAIRIFYFLLLICAGMFMRKLILLVTKNEKAALLSAVFYITVPYVLTDILIRSAMAESLMFVFIPITLIGLYYLMHEKYRSFLLYFTIGCAGMIHSHLVITLYFTIFCFICFLPKIKMFISKKKICYFLISIVATASISLPFILPLIENYLNTGYYVFKSDFMTTADNLNFWRVPFDYLLSFDKTFVGVPLMLSLLGVGTLIYSIINYRKIRSDNNKPFLIFGILICILCIYFSSTLFTWGLVPDTMLLIQFPWRLLSFVAVAMSILVGIFVSHLINSKISKIFIVLLIMVSSIISVTQINNCLKPEYAPEQNNLSYESSYIVDYVPTATPATSTDSSYIKSHTHDIIASDNQIVISDIKSNTPDLDFDVSNVSQSSTVTIPRYYYLGYEIKARYADDISEILPYYMSKDGFIEFNLEKDARITITYPGTTLQRISYYISGATLLAFICYFVITANNNTCKKPGRKC